MIKMISNALDTEIYFPYLYFSGEQGKNENANALLRQYVKKGSYLRRVTDEEINFTEVMINYQP